MEEDKKQELLQDMLNNDEAYRLGSYIYDKSGECIGVLEDK